MIAVKVVYLSRHLTEVMLVWDYVYKYGTPAQVVSFQHAIVMPFNLEKSALFRYDAFLGRLSNSNSKQPDQMWKRAVRHSHFLRLWFHGRSSWDVAWLKGEFALHYERDCTDSTWSKTPFGLTRAQCFAPTTPYDAARLRSIVNHTTIVAIYALSKRHT